eukprot:913293-Pyramimonas_sp.AAC.1
MFLVSRDHFHDQHRSSSVFDTNARGVDLDGPGILTERSRCYHPGDMDVQHSRTTLHSPLHDKDPKHCKWGDKWTTTGNAQVAT